MSPRHQPSEPRALLIWRRSSRCTMGSCVEVALTPSTVFLRDSKYGDLDDHRIIGIDSDAWRGLSAEIAVGHPEIDISGIKITSSVGGSVTVKDTETNTMLRFDRIEWSSFTAAVADGEFS